MRVEFIEMTVVGESIKPILVKSKVYGKSSDVKHGFRVGRYRVWSKRANALIWMWADHCRVIEEQKNS